MLPFVIYEEALSAFPPSDLVERSLLKLIKMHTLVVQICSASPKQLAYRFSGARLNSLSNKSK